MSLALSRNYFVLDGKSSLDFGLWTNGYKTFNGATRDVEQLIIPGRHGTLAKDNARYENCEIVYEKCGLVREGALARTNACRAWLSSHQDAFYRLTDSYHPEEFRMARYVGPFEPDIGEEYGTALVDIQFECHPERWLKKGEVWVEDPTSLFNDTLETANPVFRIFGDGTLMVGGAEIEVAQNPFEYIDIDCALGDAYHGSENANTYVSMSEVPSLPPQKETFFEFGGSGAYHVKPRWWTT